LADREQSHEVRVDGPFKSSLVNLHGAVFGADNPGTWYVRKQTERINEPSHGSDHVALDLVLAGLALAAGRELSPLHMRKSSLDHRRVVGDLDDRLGFDLCPTASLRSAVHALRLVTAWRGRPEPVHRSGDHHDPGQVPSDQIDLLNRARRGLPADRRMVPSTRRARPSVCYSNA